MLGTNCGMWLYLKDLFHISKKIRLRIETFTFYVQKLIFV